MGEIDNQKRTYYRSIDFLRLLLFPLAMIFLFGAPTAYGSWAQWLCSFSIPALYILEGYILLEKREDRKERLLRSVKKTGLFTAACLAVDLGFCLYMLIGQGFGDSLLAYFSTSQSWICFLGLNVWPFPTIMGNSMCYLLGFFYAELILLLLEKLKWLKHDWMIMTVLMVISLATGEFGGFLGINFFGVMGFENNFFTLALPMMLLGGLLHRMKRQYAKQLFEISPKYILAGIGLVLLLGVTVSFGEMFFLRQFANNRVGQGLGMWITAIGICLPAMLFPNYRWKYPILQKYNKPILFTQTALMELVRMLLLFIVFLIAPNSYFLVSCIGILTSIFSFFMALGICELVRFVKHRKKERKVLSNSDMVEGK